MTAQQEKKRRKVLQKHFTCNRINCNRPAWQEFIYTFFSSPNDKAYVCFKHAYK